jgi:hypothetical protein
MGTSPGKSTTYFVVKTRATIQERVKSPSKSKKKLQKPKPRKISRSRSCTLLRVIHPTYQNMWVITPQLLFLRLVGRKFLGHNFHLRRRYSLPTHEVSSQKGANRPINSEISGRGPKLAQLTTLCQSQNTYIEKISYLWHSFTFTVVFFLIRNNQCKPSFLAIFFKILCTSFIYVKMKYTFITDSRECRSYKEIFLRECSAKNRSKSFTEATKSRS